MEMEQDVRNGRARTSKNPFLHKGNNKTDKNYENQLFHNSRNYPKACNNLRNIYLRKKLNLS